MWLGDFLIGKPGPGRISGALQCGLPVIVARNEWTLRQERFNTDWVRRQGVGLVLKSFGTIREAVAELRARLPDLSASEHREKNRALFERPGIFDDLLDISSTACHWRPAQLEVGALGTV